MDTISQATSAIKTTLWGGNANNNNNNNNNDDDTTNQQQQPEVHRSMIDDHVTETESKSRVETDPDADGDYKLGKGPSDSDYKPEGPRSMGGVPQGANITGYQGTNDNSHSNSNEPNTGFGGGGIGAQPSVTVDPNQSQLEPSRHHQGSNRPTEEPETDSTYSGKSGDSAGSGGSGGGFAPVGGMKLPESENKTEGEGTGTLYEKSTGLYCDGGDFDATRPGAAREADRLMDEKGVKHGDDTFHGESGAPQKEKTWYGVDHSGFGGHGSHSNERPSISKSSDGNEPVEPAPSEGHNTKGLGQKIKDKLHHSSSK